MSIPAKYRRRVLSSRIGCDAWISDPPPTDRLIVDPGGTIWGHHCKEPARRYNPGEVSRSSMDIYLCDEHAEQYMAAQAARTEGKN